MTRIFVTVGTHEQPFDRLFTAIDRLTETWEAQAFSVFSQYGYSSPPRSAGVAMLAGPEYQAEVLKADLVVSHGGPGTIIPVLKSGQPIVLVPRQKVFGEHVDDHQVSFCRRIAGEYALDSVEDISQLGAAITRALSAEPRSEREDDRRIQAIGRLSDLIAASIATRKHRHLQTLGRRPR